MAMKRILYYMLTCCAALVFFACTTDENFSGNTVEDGIILDLSMGSQSVSRAVAEGPEVTVDHLDVMIFSSSDETLKWHERISNCQEQQGKVTLAAARKSFEANTSYWVYLVANSKHTAEEFAALPDLNGLKSMTQEDRLIHMTGLKNVADAPQAFLMDGVAYPGTLTQEPEASAPVVLNNGNSGDNTELKVVLRRAAAKIVVNIGKGEKVTFVKGEGSDVPGYYLRNMPYTTSVLAGINGDADLRTPPFSNTGYFNWTESNIKVTAYVYAHSWADASALERELRLVVNIPMSYKENDITDPVVMNNNYYQIPVSKDKKLERNTYYEVTVNVNAPGATDPSTPEELTGVSYTVLPWNETTVNIGGEDGRPIYLTVNEEEMEMHNITDDNTTLRFASSSNVSANITRVYYYNKFGQEREENTDIVKVTPDAGLNGGIDIHCPLPTNNTIRYIEMTVSNVDGVERQVLIRQYPLEYITNIQGWYSYRDDFKRTDSNPTTYEYSGDKITGIALATRSISNWNGKYEYLTGSDATYGFFNSKVAKLRNDGSGMSDLYYYYYNWRGNLSESAYSEYNGRMYTIVLTSTSDKYTIGRPRMIPDKIYSDLIVTDPGKDNSKLVSPSFMIGSCVGEFRVGGGNLTLDESENSVRVAREHCAHYVEVYKDKDGNKVTLDDWRLPTEEELKIIFNFQGKENQDADAMDFRLNGQYYYCASGRIYNDKYTVKGTGVACIRDVYVEK